MSEPIECTARSGSPWKGSVRLQVPLLFLGMLLCSGCHLREWVHNGFKVGPNYAKPTAPVAETWIDYRDGRVRSEPADLAHWWKCYQDPVLDELVEKAYRQNLSLRSAGARVLQALAFRGVTVGQFFPQSQTANGGFTNYKYPSSEVSPLGTPNQWFHQWNTGLSASWELDFWGRYRRSIEAADAELDASVEQYDDVLVLLLADVASAYLDYRTFELRLRYARSNVEAQEKALRIAEDKQKFGAATERDVQQARTILEQTRALVPRFQAGARVASNRLCFLLGLPPRDLMKELGPGKVPIPAPDVVIGIPADLVRRRPDIRSAERRAAAQCARIGVALSDFYPQISITGTIGLAGEDFKDLFRTPASVQGTFGPSFRWDILNYGRIANRVNIQDARFEQLLLDYQQTVLSAGREVEDALVRFLKSQEEARDLERAVKAAERTREIVFDQYTLGAVEFTAVFIAESELRQVQDQYAALLGSVALNLTQVYRALGGGWEMRLKRDAEHFPAGIAPVGSPAAPVALPAPEALPLPARKEDAEKK